MGVLNAGAEDVPGINDPEPGPEETETTPVKEAEPEPVKVQPAQKPTRREAFSKSQEELKARIEELGQKASRVDDLDKTIAEYKERLAKHEGAMEELRRQASQQRQPQTPATSHEDQVAALEEKAIEALVEKKDWRAYQKIQRQIASMEAERLYGERMRNAPAPVHPAIPALEMEFSEVAAHPAGRAGAIAFDNFLAAKGEPDGPARWRKAFEMTAQQLGYTKPAPAATDKKKEALAGVAGGKSGAKSGSGGRHVKLTQQQIEMAKKSGLGVEEYARLWADDHPEDVADD